MEVLPAFDCACPAPYLAFPIKREFTSHVFDHAIEGIFQMSPEGEYLAANRPLARIYGCGTPEDLQHAFNTRAGGLYVEPGRAQEFLRLIAKAGAISGFESEVYRMDGSTAWISENAVPVRDELGRIVCHEGFVIDISDRRATREELARTRGELEARLKDLEIAQAQAAQAERLWALGAMVNGIAHDFNNSLWMILGYGELLQQLSRKKAVPPEFSEYVDTIVKASLEAVETITRLSDFQRSAEGSAGRALLGLNEVIEKALNFTKPRWKTEASGRGTPVEVTTDFGKVERVLGNAAELCEMFTHIILNAVEAMPQGGTIKIETKVSHGEVLVSIADTGVGMTQEVQRRCMEPFFTTKGGRCTGVGLASARETVESHGGRVKVDSAPGRGAKFIFHFPVGIEAETGDGTKAVARRLRILAVDDHPIQTQLIARALGEDQHTVATAANGRDAIDLFDSECFDLVITDKAMPGMSGDQLAAAIKAREPGTPVIMLTGLGQMSDEEDLSEFVDMLVAKPASLHDLRAAISNVTR